MKFSIHLTSHTGARRHNQDRVGYAYTNDALLLVLADGMGGHLHGEVAAQIVLLTFMRAFERLEERCVREPEVFLRKTMRAAHEAILEYAHQQNLGGNPGTTCVVALVQDGEVRWAHAGDSRCYLLRNGQVAGMTHDHSVVQQWVDWGLVHPSERMTHPDRNKLTNCLGGIEDILYVEVSPPVPLQSGDTLLLCSDGFWGPLGDAELSSLSTAPELSVRLEELAMLAVRRDAHWADNTTAIAARLGDQETEHAAEVPVWFIHDQGQASDLSSPL